MSCELIVSFTIDGIHAWPNAPAEYSEFRQSHRHLFKVICYMEVDAHGYDSRVVELWDLRQQIQVCIINLWHISSMPYVCDFGSMSCEGIARWILEAMPNLTRAFVGEGENFGAQVTRDFFQSIC